MSRAVNYMPPQRTDLFAYKVRNVPTFSVSHIARLFDESPKFPPRDLMDRHRKWVMNIHFVNRFIVVAIPSRNTAHAKGSSINADHQRSLAARLKVVGRGSPVAWCFAARSDHANLQHDYTERPPKDTRCPPYLG